MAIVRATDSPHCMQLSATRARPLRFRLPTQADREEALYKSYVMVMVPLRSVAAQLFSLAWRNMACVCYATEETTLSSCRAASQPSSTAPTLRSTLRCRPYESSPA
jgi:hypothetical protein